MDDIPHLFNLFLDEAAREFGKRKPAIPKELQLLLATYHFPGNVRELRAMVFDAVGRHDKKMLSMKSFEEHIDTHGGLKQTAKPARSGDETSAGPNPGWQTASLPTLKDAENWLVSEALRRAQGNQSIAAKMLGLTRSALNKRLNRPDSGWQS